MGDLIQSYRLTAKYRNLAASTKRSYDRHVNRLRAKNEHKAVRHVTRKQVRATHEALADTPGEADRMLAVLSVLLEYAYIELEWIDQNPSKGVPKFRPQSRVTAWPQSALRAFENAAPISGRIAP